MPENKNKVIRFFKPFTDLVLYGNFWIALCGWSMYASSCLLLGIDYKFDAVAAFCAFGTLFLYGVHRIVGISRLHQFFDVDRYAVIARYKQHIQVYAIIGLLISIYCFFQFEWLTMGMLILPGLLGLGYVAPVFGEEKRLRDQNDIKIFLVAIVWAWITLLLPAVEYGIDNYLLVGCLFAERCLFIFAITLPFDIRDIKVDTFGSVKTIPARIGINKSIYLSWFSLFFSTLIISGLLYFNLISSDQFIALLILYIATAGIVFYSSPKRHDYFYSGLIDGLMILEFVILTLAVYQM